jgi:uncharacterized DUF497 family protein
MTHEQIRFEWDPHKAAANRRKHGVSFQDAQTAFYDEQALLLDDPDHSDEEPRFLLLGEVPTMRKRYDFSRARRNPYAKLLKQQVTIRLDRPTVSYFKALAADTNIPYQTLMNLYLRDCATSQKRLRIDWRP